MSDDYTIIVPADPAFLPADDARRAVERLAAEIFPRADAIELRRSERLEFVWAEEYHTRPSCPFCGADLEAWFWAEFDRWGAAEDAAALAAKLPRCGRVGSLNALAYRAGSPEAFARFQLSVVNVGVGRLGDDARRRFEAALGGPVKIVYRHR